ncbi:MAG: exo-1,3-beta-glucanase [Candelina submexicana]|nr:MAG: exo-1,3-beta-glucanase [Candelina submexicana]
MYKLRAFVNFAVVHLLLASSISASASAGEASITLAERDDGILRGINIGGWLVLEPWLQTCDNGCIFHNGVNAWDQHSFDALPGAAQALQTHWSTWFKEADVQTLKSIGINAIRIPIGFWAYDNAGTPYLKGADAYLEKAVGWAKSAGVKVWVDLHGAPGSQNGFDNSGQAGPANWQQGNNMDRTISVLETIAKKYGSQQHAGTVVGIQLLNEPISWGTMNPSITQSWTVKAYKAVREAAANKNLMIIMHDTFLSPAYFEGVPKQVGTESSRLFGVDTHLYQKYSDSDKKLNQAQHIQKACGWGSDLGKAKSVLPVFVGEFSASTEVCVNPDGSTTAGNSPCSTPGCQCVNSDWAHWNPQTIEQVRRYVEAQLDTFEANTNGYFIFNWGGPGEWNFINMVNKGVIPKPITSRKYPGQCGGKKVKRSQSKRRVARGLLGIEAS